MRSAATQAARIAASHISMVMADPWRGDASTLDAIGKVTDPFTRNETIVSEAESGHHLRTTINCTEHVDAADAPAARRARDMNACMQPSHRQRVHRVAWEAGHEPQGLQTGGNVLGSVRVHRAAAALVAGVEGSEQVDHLRPAHLANDDAIRSHAQGLPDKVAERDHSRTFEIGRSSLEAHDMGMIRAQLAGILSDDDALIV